MASGCVIVGAGQAELRNRRRAARRGLSGSDHADRRQNPICPTSVRRCRKGFILDKQGMDEIELRPSQFFRQSSDRPAHRRPRDGNRSSEQARVARFGRRQVLRCARPRLRRAQSPAASPWRRPRRRKLYSPYARRIAHRQAPATGCERRRRRRRRLHRSGDRRVGAVARQAGDGARRRSRG